MIRYYTPLLILMCITAVRIYIFCHKDLLSCASLPTTEAAVPFESFFKSIQETSSKSIRQHFPSPHSELLLGMTLGIDDLSKVPRFKQALQDTGTIHVVVVSGYNISLVFEIIIKFLGTRYKLRNLLLAQFGTLIYSLLSGFGSPVIRAFVMGSIVSWGKYYGRKIDAPRVLFFSGLVMVLIRPVFLFDLSFQLSFLATLSLVLYSDIFIKALPKSTNVFFESFTSTMAAQILVWPLISYRFGRVSLISPIVNTLILWTVPLSTMLGGLMLLVEPAGSLVKWFALMPLDIFVMVINFFGSFNFSSIVFTLTLNQLIIYYLLAMLPLFVISRKRS